MPGPGSFPMTLLRGWNLPAVTLLLAAGLLAALLAAGVFAPEGVGAHRCDPDTPEEEQHLDFHGNPCVESGHDNPHETSTEVDGGRDSLLEFRFYPPLNTVEGNRNIPEDHEIAIILVDFDFSEAIVVDTAEGRMLIEIAGSREDRSDNKPANSVDIDKENKQLTLGFPAFDVAANEFVIITIKPGTGILPPETPQGFDGEEPGYPVTITFGGDPIADEEMDKNVVVVKNPVSSTVPGATVRIELETYAIEEIGSNEEIVIDFSGPSEDASFGLPTTIATSRIKIRSEQTFDPADVLVQGDRVTLTIPDDKVVARNRNFTISISQLARIRNPFAAGNRIITISTFIEQYEPDRITAVIRRTTTVSPLEGPRGSQFTLSGKGYAQGTVTVFEGDDDKIGPGETLASVKTSRGSFTSRLEARGEPGGPAYRIWTRDSNGAIHFVEFNFTSSMSLQPSIVGTGDRLRITIADWEDPHEEVAAVRIGGVDAYTAIPIEYSNCFDPDPDDVYTQDDEGEISFEVTVPIGVPPGEQTLAVYGHEQLELVDENGVPIENKEPCADLPGTQTRGNLVPNSNATTRVKSTPDALVEMTVEIVVHALIVSPSTAVRGQRVTISGTGFTQVAGRDQCPSTRSRMDICSITIDGEDVAEDVSQFEVSHDGRVWMTVTVPVGARDGENEVQVNGRNGTQGTGSLTVPEPSITVIPPQGQRGEEATVEGIGFSANGVVVVSYGDEKVAGGQTDGRGNFELSFRVPLDAAIGRTNQVTAEMKVDGREDLRAAVDHSPPSAQIATQPDLITRGDRMTIRGENLPPFSLVRSVHFALRDFTPVPNVSTDRNGRFEIEIPLQGVDVGDQPLRVEVADVVVTQVVEVALPPLSGPPDQVFKELIIAGVLNRIWHLDSAEQEWTFFDPRTEYSEFNTLKEVSSGDILSVNLASPHRFQGDRLLKGWQLILLD